MYCGNNSENPDLLSGKLQIGNRYGCLRKGIGKGLHMPIDENYLGPYSPIDKRKVYCGKQDDIPDSYDIIGSLPHCLQKGIGIGKLKKALDSSSSFSSSSSFPSSSSQLTSTRNKHFIIFSILWVFLIVAIFAILYYTKPSCITYKDYQGVVKIDNTKFIIIYISICVGLTIPFIILANSINSNINI
jgi:hypothetical protein